MTPGMAAAMPGVIRGWHDPECREAHCVSLSEGSCKVSNANTYQGYIGMAGILFFLGRKKPPAKLANCSNINRQI